MRASGSSPFASNEDFSDSITERREAGQVSACDFLHRNLREQGGSRPQASRPDEAIDPIVSFCV